MTELMCRYAGDREQAIVAYLYGEAEENRDERARFETHLAACDTCRAELAAFEDVQVTLGQWTPPALRSVARPGLDPASTPLPAPARRSSWRDIPVWAQTAAALLCLGAAAGIANLDVEYGPGGLRVRTGWSPPVASASAPAAEQRPAAADNAPWRGELTALEARLRADLRQAAAAPASPELSQAPDMVRRVRALVDESERRQQRELALRVGEVLRDVNAQRQADLARIDQNIGAMQSNTGREMLRQRSEMLNYVTVRTASQRGQ